MSKKYLSEVNIYPVKSCKGTRVDSIHVGPKGPHMDRRWMVVDKEGRFISQRTVPRLSLVHVNLDNRYLFLSTPKMMPLMIPLQSTGSTCQVQIWNDTCMAIDLGDKAASWLSNCLQVDCRFVFLPEESIRKVNPQYAHSPQNEVSFADGFPFLLISEASLENLNLKLPQKIRMNRFRPNLVVANCKPYEEDSWKQIRIGEIIFHIVKPCTRCIITTIEQETANKGSEPLATLASFRKEESGKIIFGQNLVHEGSGIISRGAEVEVLALL